MITFKCDGCGKQEQEKIGGTALAMEQFMNVVPIFTPLAWAHIVSKDNVRWLACSDKCVQDLSKLYADKYGITPEREEDPPPPPARGPNHVLN